MILKIKDFKKNDTNKFKIFLFYGSNEGHKNEILNNFFLNDYKGSVFRYEEKDILDNITSFYENIFTESLFDNEKIIILSRASDKSERIISEILIKNLKSIKIILLSNILDKKSKIRNLFEKEKDLLCIPFYEDNNITLNKIAYNFFKQKKINISNQSINFLADRMNGDRINLNNELNKIDLYTNNTKKIDIEELKILTNLSDNYSVSELTDNCLAKNLKRLTHILNENNFSSEDCVLILRTILNKSKRNLKIRILYERSNDLEKALSLSKPPIFWKEKEIVKNQASKWSLKDAEKLIYKIHDVELIIKKNYYSSLNIVSDFILNTAK